jgi:predicted SnoaL-like aldol condensation-catalyzing enzyme
MQSLKSKIVGVALLAAAIFPASAEFINPPTTPQTAPLTSSEKKNLAMVLTWWREVIQGRHTELAPKYQAEDYIQHNPNIETGRAAFVKFFAGFGPPINPIPAKLSPEPVVSGARGDFVWLIWEHEAKDPRDPSNSYRYNSFDILRIEKGKVQEHWDDAKKQPGNTAFIVHAPGSQSKGSTGTLSKTEQQNLAMATEELKDMLQYGHLELADKTMDPGYLQHNPNVPQGRDGFKQFMSRVPGRTPQEIKPEWKNAPSLTLVDGPYVVMMWDRREKEPGDGGREYTWNHFDVVRVDGQIKEHWDEARVNPPQPGAKK